MKVKYPDIEVQLTGEDGNAFSIIGKVSKALKRYAPSSEVEEFRKEAMSGDYNNLLETFSKWVTVL